MSFAMPESGALQMDEALQGALNGELGALLQERLEFFGEDASQQLEAMFDGGLMEQLDVESYCRDSGRFVLDFMTGIDGEDLMTTFWGCFSCAERRRLRPGWRVMNLPEGTGLMETSFGKKW
ncbi:MAG: hypothetical protein AB2598_10740 [Candidatus Thiodiazotropha sp.]